MEKLNYETIQSYQSYSTVEEMDKSVRGFLYKHKSSLSEGTFNVLQFIWRHSVKVIGVSFAKYDTIANGLQISRRTVIRAMKKLESLGFIKKIPTVRMNGKQGVNLLIIQACEPIEELINNVSPHDVTTVVTANKTENKQSSLCENKNKPTYVRKQDTSTDEQVETVQNEHSPTTAEQLDTSFLPESVHKEFVQAAKPFLSAFEIYKLWNRVLIVYNKMNLEQYLDDVIDPIIHALKQTIFMKKMRKIHTTFEGYFYRVVYEMLLVEKRRETKHLLYDFFED